jgi:hypothetical protein
VPYTLDTVAITEPTPGGENDDYLLTANSWALVLDGISAPPVDVGCQHSVPWFVARLGTHLAAGLATDLYRPLTDVLADAIRRTAADHGPSCDLTHPLTPGATVAIVRISEPDLDWLVLGDAAIAWQLSDGTTAAATDDRAARSLLDAPLMATGVRRANLDYVAKIRNTPEGFWVAAADPDAAEHAITGDLRLDRLAHIALYSDGITRLVERYGRSWAELFALADTSGARALVAAVRAAELDDPKPSRWRGKRHDDATAVIAKPVRHRIEADAGHPAGTAGRLSRRR